MRKQDDRQEQLPVKQLDSGGFTQKRVNHEENSCFEWGLSGSWLLESLLLLGKDQNTACQGVCVWMDLATYRLCVWEGPQNCLMRASPHPILPLDHSHWLVLGD